MKKFLKKLWYFIWEDNSVLSWVVNIVLAFILIKFLVYPGLGFVLATGSPVVAVVSGSMEHNSDFDSWWSEKTKQYELFNITQENFETFNFKNGFNKGDLMLLKGKSPEELKVGDVIVFRGGEADPVIHRIVSKEEVGNQAIFSTKGDNNANQLVYEKTITEERVLGKAIVRIPYLGYVKIAFSSLINGGWLNAILP